MANASSIVFSGIVPHPPIMVPEVGRDAIDQVRASIDAMKEFTQRLIDCEVETVVLISPHAPLDATAFVAYSAPNLQGDFANFRARDTKLNFQLDAEMLEAITTEAALAKYEVLDIDSPLDHGSAVPLYFLNRNGWQGRVVVMGYNFLSNSDHVLFGNAIKAAADGLQRRTAFVASGDLSHRLKVDAPAGYSPDAHRFDEEVVEALEENAPQLIAEIDHGLRRTAGECGYRSLLVALGVIKDLPASCEVLRYEAPFGVGYLVAQFTKAKSTVSARTAMSLPHIDAEKGTELPAFARRVIETFVKTGTTVSPTEAPEELQRARAACFVSIKTADGDLRGCVGTIEPTRSNLAEELVANAISAATRDPRFEPVGADELSNLKYSVDVLGAIEPTTMDELDPKVYGVIVEDEAGQRRGLLLPDIAGIEDATQQVEIAARKAGIFSDTPVRLSRFRVDRFREKSKQ